MPVPLRAYRSGEFIYITNDEHLRRAHQSVHFIQDLDQARALRDQLDELLGGTTLTAAMLAAGEKIAWTWREELPSQELAKDIWEAMEKARLPVNKNPEPKPGVSTAQELIARG